MLRNNLNVIIACFSNFLLTAETPKNTKSSGEQRDKHCYRLNLLT